MAISRSEFSPDPYSCAALKCLSLGTGSLRIGVPESALASASRCSERMVGDSSKGQIRLLPRPDLGSFGRVARNPTEAAFQRFDDHAPMWLSLVKDRTHLASTARAEMPVCISDVIALTPAKF